eukprot:2645183-Prymnesium_polylepis.1
MAGVGKPRAESREGRPRGRHPGRPSVGEEQAAVRTGRFGGCVHICSLTTVNRVRRWTWRTWRTAYCRPVAPVGQIFCRTKIL